MVAAPGRRAGSRICSQAVRLHAARKPGTSHKTSPTGGALVACCRADAAAADSGAGDAAARRCIPHPAKRASPGRLLDKPLPASWHRAVNSAGGFTNWAHNSKQLCICIPRQHFACCWRLQFARFAPRSLHLSPGSSWPFPGSQYNQCRCHAGAVGAVRSSLQECEHGCLPCCRAPRRQSQ